MKPAFNSLFTVYVPLSVFVSLSLVCPCLPLAVSLYLSTLPTRRFITHLHTGTAFPLLFLRLHRSISLSLSLSLSVVFLAAWCKSRIWAAKRSFFLSLSLPLFQFKLHSAFINVTGQKPVLSKHFPIDRGGRLYVTCVDRELQPGTLVHVHGWCKCLIRLTVIFICCKPPLQQRPAFERGLHPRWAFISNLKCLSFCLKGSCFNSLFALKRFSTHPI